eukprot:UN01798
MKKYKFAPEKNYMYGLENLVNHLTVGMAESMRFLNPPCKEEINMTMLPD